MGVAVLVIRRRREQPAAFAKGCANRAIGRVEFGVDDAALPAEPRPVGAVFAVTLNREDRINAVCLAQIKIILAVIGRHMDKACAAVSGDEITGEERAGTVEEGYSALKICVVQ